MLKSCKKCIGGKLAPDWYGELVCINCGCPEDNHHPDPPEHISTGERHPGTKFPDKVIARSNKYDRRE